VHGDYCAIGGEEGLERKGRRGCGKTPNHFEIEEFIPQGIKVSLI